MTALFSNTGGDFNTADGFQALYHNTADANTAVGYQALLNTKFTSCLLASSLNTAVAQQQKGMEVLAAQLKEQSAQIQKVSAQLEVNKPAPRTVVDNR